MWCGIQSGAPGSGSLIDNFGTKKKPASPRPTSPPARLLGKNKKESEIIAALNKAADELEFTPWSVAHSPEACIRLWANYTRYLVDRIAALEILLAESLEAKE